MKYLDSGLESASNFIERTNDDNFTNIQVNSQMNPAKNRKWRDSAEVLMKMTELIHLQINSLNKLNFAKDNQSLITSLNKFESFVLKLNEKSPFNDSIKKHLNLIKESKILNEHTMNHLINNLKFISYYSLSYIKFKTQAKRFYFSKLEPFIVVESNYLRVGDIYRAEIMQVGVDTTFQPLVVIEKDTLKIENGKAIYQKFANKTGVFKYKGEIIVVSQANDTSKYPFQSEYKVIER